MSKDILILGIIAILPFLAFWQLWTPDMEDRYILTGDTAQDYFPMHYFYANSLKKWEFSLWNPYSQAGHPVLGNLELAPFYPPDMAQSLFFKKEVFKFFEVFEKRLIFHLSLAGLFMYLLMTKGFGLSIASSFLSSIVFMFNQAMLFQLQSSLVISAVWMPALFLCFLKYHLTSNFRYLLSGGIFFGIALLTNSPHILYYFCLIIMGILMYFIYLGVRERRGLGFIASWLFIPLIGIGIAAAQLVPLFEYLLFYSTRQGSFNYMESIGNATSHFVQFKMLILPCLAPVSAGWHSAYLGVLPLILVLLGIVFFSHPLKRMLTVSLLAIWLLAAGHYFFINDLLYLFLPGYKSVHVTGRIYVFAQFFLTILAGFGMEYIGSDKLKEQKRFLRKLFAASLSIAAALLILCLAVFLWKTEPVLTNSLGLASLDRLDRKLWAIFFAGASCILLLVRLNKPAMTRNLQWVIIGFVLLDLLSAIKINPSTGGYIAHLNSTIQGEYKDVMKDLLGLSSSDSGGEKSIKDILNKRVSAYYQTNLYKGLRNYNGYQASGLIRYYQYLAYAGIAINPDQKRYVRDFYSDEIKPKLIDLLTGRSLFIASRYRVAKGDRDILSLLNDPGFDLNNEVILEEYPQDNADNTHLDLSGNDATFRFLHFSNNRLKMEIFNPYNTGYLVYIDNYYPGWRAYIDGKKTKIYRADYTFKAITLPYGTHKIEFTFLPISFIAGAIISCATLALVGFKIV